jgi:cell division protein FtsZ
MSINLRMPQTTELKPRITVFGVGGAGGNAVNNMIESNLQGVEFVAANADAQALHHSRAERQIQIGTAITEGLGAGSRPEVGRAAAEESLPEIIDNLVNTHMVFITAGMGGGTGTGAAPVIAQAAREQGILTVGVVTKPFQFEGSRRMRIAEEGIDELQQYVDTLIIIPNQNLFRVANEKTTFADAFAMADEVLHSGVRGITDLMVMPGLINLDFADVRTVMDEMGKAMMGTGEATGEKRALEAAEAAISNPLLDEVSMKGARGVLINITGGMDLTLFEVDEAANRIRSEVDPEANIIVGSTFDENMEGPMRVSVVATGINVEALASGGHDAASNVAVLKRPERPAWRAGAGNMRPSAGGTQSAAIGSAAIASEAPDPAQDKLELASPDVESQEAAPVPEAARQEAIDEAASALRAERPEQNADGGSTAQDLIQRASEFATKNERKPQDATPPRTESAAVTPAVEPPAAEILPEGEERMLPGLEAPAEPRVRRKRGGLLSRVSGGRQRLFSQSDEEEAPKERIEPVATPKKAQGNPDAPKVKLDPGVQLNDPSIPEDKLDIPAFLRRPSS